MKKYISYIVLFFVVVAVIDFCFGKACDYMTKHAKSGENKQLVDLCENEHYDMLVMGSSKAHHNYIPQVFSDSLGLTCYNAGYDGNGVILAYGILNLIDEEKLPDLVVYDVKQQFDIYCYNGDGDHTRYYQKLKKFNDKRCVKEIIGDISKWDLLKLRSGLIRYNGDIINTVSGYIRCETKDKNYGYVPAVGQLSESNIQEKDYSLEIDSVKIDYFKRLIKVTKEKNIKLVVVLSPEFNSPYSDDFKPVRDICTQEQVPVIDFFEETAFQNIYYFKDHCHLNEKGALLFTQMMINELRNIN